MRIRQVSALLWASIVLLPLGLAIPAAAQTSKLKIASTVREIFDNLPLYVAQEGGYYKKHGVDIELIHFSGGGEVVRAVSSGASDIGMVGTSAAIIAVSRGEPMRIFSAWSAPSFGIVFIVPVNSPIKTVEDLAGKKVGFTRPGSVSHTGLVAALAAMKIKADAIPVGAPGDGWAMLKAGRIEATWHTAPDVYSLIDRGEARILFDSSEYLKDYQQGALAAAETTLAKSADALTKFLAAIEEANALISANATEASKLGGKGMSLPPAQLEKMVTAMPKGFFKLGPVKEANFGGSLAEAVAAGNLKQQPTYQQVVDTRLFPNSK